MKATLAACTAGLLLTFCQAASAENARSANNVMQGCRAAVSSSNKDSFLQGVCAGTVDAAATLFKGTCLPEHVTVGQTIRVVVKYIDDRPERQHELFLSLAAEALRASWPCRNWPDH
jgi:hypothetical protein